MKRTYTVEITVDHSNLMSADEAQEQVIKGIEHIWGFGIHNTTVNRVREDVPEPDFDEAFVAALFGVATKVADEYKRRKAN